MASTKAWKAGSAYVQISPSLDNFQNDIRDELRKYGKVEVDLDPKLDPDRAKKEFDKATRKVRADNKAGLQVDVDLNTDKAERQHGAFITSLQARTRAAMSALPDLELDADASKVDREIARLLARLKAIANQDIDVDFDAAKALAEIRLLRAELLRLGKQSVDVKVRTEVATAARQLSQFLGDKAETEIGSYALRARARLESALASLPSVELDVDSSRLDRQLAGIRADLADLGSKRIGLDISAEDFERELDALDRRLRRLLGHEQTTLQLRVDVDQANKALDSYGHRARLVAQEAAEAHTRAWDQAIAEDHRRARKATEVARQEAARRAEIEMGAYGRQARDRLDSAIGAIRKIDLDIDSTEAERKLATIRHELTLLRDQRIGIDIDAATFEAEIARLRQRLADLAKDKTANVDVDVDAGAAMAKLALADAAIRRVDGRRATTSFDVTGVARGVTMLGLITAAVAAVAAAASPAVAGLAAIGTMAGAAGQGLTVMVAGLWGVGDAVKALGDQEEEAAAGTAVSAASRANSAQQIITAQRALEQAQIGADRASITGAQQVGDARRALAEAHVSAAERIERAERSLATAREQAARSAADAERTVRDAQRASTDAQADLNRARKEAVQRLRDLGFALRDAALDEREALLQVKYAQEALAQGTAHGLQGEDMQRLQDQASRAQLSLEQVQARYGDLRDESAEFARTGVEGSDQVVAAQRRVADAAEAAILAQQRLATTQRDGARSVADAERALTQARVDGARDVSRAQEQLARAQQSAAWAQADAARSVADAQRALANAYTDAGLKGTAAADKVAEAMAGLSPAAQRFAIFLHTEMIPGLEGIGHAVQEALLPRLETSLRNLGKLTPELTAGFRDTARTIGDLSIEGTRLMSSGPFRRDFAAMMAANNSILDAFGHTGINLVDAFRHIYLAAAPLAERFARMTERASETFAAFLAGARASGDLAMWFTNMGDRLAWLGGEIKDVIVALFHIAEALVPLGETVIWLVAGFVEWVGVLAQVNPTLLRVIASVVLFYSAIATLARYIGGLTVLSLQIVDVFKSLVPNALLARMGLLSTATASATAATGANAAAATAATGAQTGLAGAVGKVGRALPIVGAAAIAVTLAWDHLVASQSEATEAMLQGGAAAADMRAQLEGQSRWVEILTTKLGGVIPVFGAAGIIVDKLAASTGSATDAYNAHIASLGPLEAAQQRVREATANHALALRDHEPLSHQVVAAELELQAALRDLELQQLANERATTSHNQALFDQHQQMLAGVDAAIRYDGAVLNTEAAIKRLNETLAEHSAESYEGRVAINQVEAALRQQVDAAGEAASAALSHMDATTQDQAAVKAMNDEIVALIIQMGSNAPPALLAMAEGMGAAGLKARGATIRVDELGRKVAELPGGVTIVLDANPGPAYKAIDAFIRSVEGRQILLPVKADIGPLGAQRRATGGAVEGPGTSTSDSVVARLSAGEHVWTAREVSGAGGHERVARLRAKAASGSLPQFAAGGAVGSTQITSLVAQLGLTGRPDHQLTLMQRAAREALGAVQELSDGGLAVLAEQLDAQTIPALEALTRRVGIDTPTAVRLLAQTTVDSGKTASGAWANHTAAVNTASARMQAAATQTAVVTSQQWANLRAGVAGHIGVITGPVFGGMHQGMHALVGGTVTVTDQMRAILGRVRAYFADPLRWALQIPINKGLRPAWGEIDRFFSLDRPWGGVPVTFSTGGPVPGFGSGDIVPSLLAPGEFVVRKEIAEPTRHFLEALNDGQAEAIQAAGGRFRRFALGGTVKEGLAFAKAQHGKPYIWGGVGPRGYDCSGLMSAIANRLMNRNPHQRIGTTGSSPWSGWLQGLKTAFGVGYFKGSPGHMAGTLAGNNVESGGSPSLTKFIQNAAGATHPQFRGHMSLPQVGGRFISAGPGGGIDVSAKLDSLLAETHRLLRDFQARFAGLPSALMTRFGLDSIAGARGAVYDGGGWLPPGYSSVWNGSGRPEPVLSPGQWDAVGRNVRGGDGDQITYHIHQAANPVSVAHETERLRRFNRRIGAGL